MENRKNTVKIGKTELTKKQALLLGGAGLLLLTAVILGVLWGQWLLPVGCAFLLMGIWLWTLKLRFDSGSMTFFAHAAFTLMIVVGGVLLFNGFSGGMKTQDDADYTKSLGVSVQEVLAKENSEGEKYTVILDGVFSRRLLPQEYVAESADEIGYVLIANTVHSKTGTYSGGGTAYTTNISITLKSLKNGETLSTYTVYGGDPPSHVRISPLDPNKDRYGKAPSDESIRSACVSMITSAQREQERKSRVVLLSEDELLAFIRGIISQNANAQGWAGMSTVEYAIKDANPDFSIKDYGWQSLVQYFKEDPHYAVQMRDIRDVVNYFSSQDLVRWAGE